jgi:hypothetical protein
MNTLYLTDKEKILFDMLPEDLREGWTVEKEVISFIDTYQKLQVRLALLRVHDPDVKSLRTKIQHAQQLDEVEKSLRDFDLKKISDDDMAALFFALGPALVTRMIFKSLQEVKDDKDMESLTALTVIRNTILASYSPVA